MKKQPTIPDLIWQFFCSVKLTVYTLLLLAATSVIGTVILQNESPQNYVKLYGEGFYNLIKVFNFDDMYHAWWFLALIVILCVNIVVCSIERLSVTWKIIFPKAVKFNPDRFRKQKNLLSFENDGDVQSLVDKYETFLSKTIGKVIKQTTDTGVVLYAEKGRWTRIGVYIVHSSILLLLVGALIGALFGFKARMNLDEGKTSDTAFIMKQGIPVKLGFAIRCDDFDVQFYNTGAPADYRSTLTVIEDGKESFTKDIRVNHPLRYKGINVFQSSYGQASSSNPEIIGIEVLERKSGEVSTHQMKIGQQITLPGDHGLFTLEKFDPHYAFRDNDLGQALVGTLTAKDGTTTTIGLPLRFPSFDKMRKGDLYFSVKELEKKYYTGLQITRDPGIWYVYAGFILMIIGCWVTFFMSHQSYLLEIHQNKNSGTRISISGITNRNSQGMKLKINSIVNKLKGK